MKKLGQHFLKNKNKIKKIIEALELKNGDVIIEIGAGHGELTNELIKKNYDLKIIAIEKDKRLGEILKNSIAANKNLIEIHRNSIEIIEGDVLKILPLLIKNSGYKIVGNIPYYLTGRLLRVLGELKNKPKLIVLTLQKEVAERITAKPPRMNLLAASIQFWAKPKIIDYISKNDFYPHPQVDSAIVKLTPLPITDYQLINRYYKLIKILFKQPRKTILNNLKINLDLENKENKKLIKKILELKINYNDRPQNLSLEKLKNLAKFNLRLKNDY